MRKSRSFPGGRASKHVSVWKTAHFYTISHQAWAGLTSYAICETLSRASLHTYLVLALCFCAQLRIGGSLVLSGPDVSHYQCAGKHRAMASSSSIARASRQPFRISFELSSLGFACARRYSLVSISRDQADLPQQMLFAWTDS